MTRLKHGTQSVWTVVYVKRGFIERVRIFESREAADRLCRRWRKKLNPDYDEVAVKRSHVEGRNDRRE